MEPECSLPATFPYPEPIHSSPCHPIRLLEDPFSYPAGASVDVQRDAARPHLLRP